MSSHDRDELRVPSAWDIAITPELAPLFVLDAAICATRRFIEGSPPDCQADLRPILKHMRRLLARIREHRAREQVLANHVYVPHEDDLDPDSEAEVPD